jgi:malate synthase
MLTKVNEQKLQIEKKIQPYYDLIVSQENYTEITKIRAELNKERTKIDKERKDINKVVNDAYKDITALYDDLLTDIDTKLETSENERKAVLLEDIKLEYALSGLSLPFDVFFDEKWLSRTFITNWQTDFAEKVQKVKDEIMAVKQVSDEAYNRYLECGDITKALTPTTEYSDNIAVGIPPIITIKLINPAPDQVDKVEQLLVALGVEYEINGQ